MKIVINHCWGGFSLSRKAVEWLREKKHRGAIEEVLYGEKYPDGKIMDSKFCENSNLRYVERNDPLLVKCVKALKDEANGEHAKLKIVEIPDDVKWEIDDYDGMETIAEAHQRWS